MEIEVTVEKVVNLNYNKTDLTLKLCELANGQIEVWIGGRYVAAIAENICEFLTEPNECFSKAEIRLLWDAMESFIAYWEMLKK